jgi:hypothetical protein
MDDSYYAVVIQLHYGTSPRGRGSFLSHGVPASGVDPLLFCIHMFTNNTCLCL